MHFVDLEMVYDFVPQHLWWEVLQKDGVSGLLLHAIQSMYVHSEYCVHVLSVKLKMFNVDVRLNQGAVFSFKCRSHGHYIKTQEVPIMVGYRYV